MQINIPASVSSASRLYRCAVSNPAGTVYSCSVMITLADAPPVIMKQPADVISEIGNRIYFSFVANGAEAFQWQASVNGGRTWYNTSATGNTSDTLHVQTTQTTLEMLFRCVVSNANGTTVTDAVRIIPAGSQ